jgi:hypothetical protein
MVAPKPTPVAQVYFNSRNLKSAPAAQLLFFSDFFTLAFQKVLFGFLHLKSTPRGTKSTTVVASQSPLYAAI